MTTATARPGRHKKLLYIIGGVLVALCALVVFRSVFVPKPPNILLISLCSVRPDHMSLYGYRRRTTPAMELLAKDSIVFEHAVTQWPKTVPAFAAIMTGKYAHTTGLMRFTTGQYLEDEHETVAEVLAGHGYATGAFISSAALNRKTNILQGCETIIETFRIGHEPYIKTTDRVVNWLKQRRDEPFFAWVHYNNAHYPYLGGGAPANMFVDDEYYDPGLKVKVNTLAPLPLDVREDHPARRELVRGDMGGVHPGAVLSERPNELDFYVARYDAGIFATDQQVDRLLGQLKTLELLKNTIVVVIGDHGESLGEHNYYFEHGRFPYDDCARVPLLIRPVGGVEAIRVGEPVASFGLAPTLLEMIGINLPDNMEAKPFRYSTGEATKVDLVFMESGYQTDYTLSVREGRWKLIYVPNNVDKLLMTGNKYELYNLAIDPSELNTLTDQEEETTERLRRVILEWSKPWMQLAYGEVGRKDVEYDAQTIEQLRSLGYVE